MRRRLVFLGILLASLLIQLTVAPEISIGTVRPDILLVTTICWALFEGPSRGVLFGFWAGLLEDVFSTAMLGVTAFAKTIIGYCGGELRQRIVSRSVLWPMAIVFMGSILHELLKFGVWGVVGLEDMPPFSFGAIAGLALYNALITMAVYPLIRRFSSSEEKPALFP